MLSIHDIMPVPPPCQTIWQSLHISTYPEVVCPRYFTAICLNLADFPYCPPALSPLFSEELWGQGYGSEFSLSNIPCSLPPVLSTSSVIFLLVLLSACLASPRGAASGLLRGCLHCSWWSLTTAYLLSTCSVGHGTWAGTDFTGSRKCSASEARPSGREPQRDFVYVRSLQQPWSSFP